MMKVLAFLRDAAAKARVDAATKRHDEICAIVYPHKEEAKHTEKAG